MDYNEVKKVNTIMLMKLCREIGEKENLNKEKAKLCTLIINDALVQLKEI